ncbi:pyridine nucleotide-disulfide oxidoreductase/dicluster-binding protein [Candidatus Formimonas warabiya]|nr:pyridine nucleotide-disulfide oxidoreductase/dicluster-binding protein [Candidatus Formimonas warabiya]
MFKRFIEPCVQGADPYCSVVCPLNLDIRSIIDKIQRKDFNGAYRLYRNQTLFPAIVSRICDAPCTGVCVRRNMDASVSLPELERACIDHATNTAPTRFHIPLKHKKIAIIGAGLTGLSAGLKLASRGYDVAIYEQQERLGGRMHDLLPGEIIQKEIANQFQHLEYKLFSHRKVDRLEDLEFDAALIATGAGGEDFGLLASVNKGSLATSKTGVFMGGNIFGVSPLMSVENGIRAANAMEKFLKVGSMEGYGETYDQKSTCLKLPVVDIGKADLVRPVNQIAYTADEAVKEAKRCLKCDCNFCKASCALLHYFDKFPAKVANDVLGTIYPVDTLTKRAATRMINMCNLCGLCKEVCPEKIDLGELMLTSRKILHQDGVLPPAFHEFWLQDMAFSNGEHARFVSNAPGSGTSDYLFFPGCQLGSSDPAYVEKSYAYLREKIPHTGIMVTCCGAPAEWAGDQNLHGQMVHKIRADWEKMGRPRVVFACPTCMKMFAGHLPEIPGLSLYEIIMQHGLPEGFTVGPSKLSIFDPCSSRYQPAMQKSVRGLAKAAGFALEEINLQANFTQCCGWGGNIYAANPQYAWELAAERTGLGTYPYLTYCANCRDIFAATGKSSRHILDIVFDIHGENRKPPSLTERRNNKVILKQNLSKAIYGGEEKGKKVGLSALKLKISDVLTEKMNKCLILEDDVSKTIMHCEQTGRKLIDAATGYFIGHLQLGAITYWAVYKGEGDSFEVINVYSHRLKIVDGG